MRSFSLLRTNVGLTTNIKLVVDSAYNLYAESIDSNPDLNSFKYKKIQFTKDNYWDNIISSFYKGTLPEISYFIKHDDDEDIMSTDFSNQIDDLYNCGSRNIIDNKNYTEDYEYFAPLHVSKTGLPTNFIIFRVDGPGIIDLSKNNFNSEIISKLKVVKNFDLTPSTVLGEFLNKNILKNDSFPATSLSIDFRRLEFSSWIGIDYDSGGYQEKPFLLEDYFSKENTLLDNEKKFFSGFKDNRIVYPYIINFSFLFDDVPASKGTIRKWSINRYFGFYFNSLDLKTYVCPNSLPSVYGDCIISNGNIIESPSNPDSPFINSASSNVDKYPYIEVDGRIYKVEKFLERQDFINQKTIVSSSVYKEIKSRPFKVKYKILSEVNIDGKQSLINKNTISISTSIVDNTTFILRKDGSHFDIDGFDSISDIWLMDIEGTFFRIIRGLSGYLEILSDYIFSQTADEFKYYISSTDSTYNKSILLSIDKFTPPKKFGIYSCNFTDIKDFDLDLVDTKNSLFEYDQDDIVNKTDETKLYVKNLSSLSNPKDLDDFKISSQVVHIPTTSEYTSNDETFRIVNNSLSEIWRKNPTRVKWGFHNSLSARNYPYLLNNSFSLEDYNRDTNTYDPNPSRQERNLDYFYTINSSSPTYSFHSLHVEDVVNGQINATFSFDLKSYVEGNYDYFSYFFGKKNTFKNGEIIKNDKKWSYFNVGNKDVPNTTLFRGIKFKIFNVSSINYISNKIQNINMRSSNDFDDYKFSILLSENSYDPKTELVSINSLRWKIIENWKSYKTYPEFSLVIWNETIYQANKTTKSISPNVNPHNSPDWDLGPVFNGITHSTIFYSKNVENNLSSYTGFDPVVYNYGEYWKRNPNSKSNITFWDPNNLYSINDVVIYQGRFYSSNINRNSNTPIGGLYSYTYTGGAGWLYTSSWSLTQSSDSIWSKVLLWQKNINYEYGFNCVVYNNVLYGTTSSNITDSAPDSTSSPWVRIHSFYPDRNYVYGPSFSSNNIIKTNSKYYLCVENNSNSLLDNGIYVYINKKYKNILVNIYVNDNTYRGDSYFNGGNWNLSSSKLSSTDRDDIYTDLYYKLVAKNFISYLKDFSNTYGFSSNIKYLIIDENGNKSFYDFNLGDVNSTLPYFLTCDGPDSFLVTKDSLKIMGVGPDSNILKATKVLNNGLINSKDEINYYNQIPLASVIISSNSVNDPVFNFSGLKNELYNYMYRHSGYYSPIFKEVELFESSSTYSVGNYKFDTTLTYFGLSSEIIISKVNRNSNILKLRNNTSEKSIYPMIDEFGYTYKNFLIFKSSWDLKYLTEVYIENGIISIGNKNLSIGLYQPTDITKNESLL